MFTDTASTRAASQVGSIRRLLPVAPDDAATLPGGVTRGLFVGVEGAVAVVDAHGNAAIFQSAASQYHPLCVAQVRAAGTTAGGIVALY